MNSWIKPTKFAANKKTTWQNTSYVYASECRIQALNGKKNQLVQLMTSCIGVQVSLVAIFTDATDKLFQSKIKKF